MKLTGRNCIISGASRGLGAHLARRFWHEGASLLLIARDEPSLRQLCEALPSQSAGQRISCLRCDLGDRDATAQIVRAARQAFESLTVLVNNAAIVGPVGPIWESDWQSWEQACRVNLLAPAQLLSAVIPWMRERSYGKIINLSGGGATSPRANFTAYGTSKAALVRLTEIVAHELHGTGIDVNAMSPGMLNTSMLDEVRAAGAEKVGAADFKRIAELQEGESDAGLNRAADLAVFLASAESDGITGRVISAVWDPWPRLGEHRQELDQSDVYTLRRIEPRDRGFDWS